jgi:thymidine kinase
MDKGSLEVICGSMFSGKTEKLMRQLRRAEYAKKNVLTIKHHIDNRKSYTCISSHTNQKREAFSIGGSDATQLDKIIELSRQDVDVVGIDETHFFPNELIGVVCTLIDNGKQVIAAGLDLDFRGVPFDTTTTLMAFADQVTKLSAICLKCGENAFHTQRIINGKPAKYNDPIILVGAEECYEARCRNCFEINKPKQYDSVKPTKNNESIL